MSETIIEKEVEKKALTIPEQARTFIVETGAQYEAAANFLKGIKTLRKEICAHHDPMCEAAKAAHNAACAARKKFTDPIDEAEKIIKERMGSFVLAEERRRVAEQARLEKEAREKAEKIALEQAKIAEEAGDKQLADDIVREAIETPPVVNVQSEMPKVKGTGAIRVWKFKLLDVTKLDRKYLVPDEAKIRSQIKALGKDAEKLFGNGAVLVYQDVQINSRTN